MSPSAPLRRSELCCRLSKDVSNRTGGFNGGSTVVLATAVIAFSSHFGGVKESSGPCIVP